MRISATFQSADGPQLSANFNVPSATAAQTLSRPLSGGQANVAVNLVEPGQLFGERINRSTSVFAKVLTFGRTRTNLGVDLFDALNVNTPTSYNQTFGPRWLTPTQIMPARFVKISVQLAAWSHEGD